MTISGHHLIAGRDATAAGSVFQAVNPATNQPMPGAFGEGTAALVDEALRAADAAFDDLRSVSPEIRATLLEAIGEEIMALGDDLLDRTHAETGYPMPRLQAERGRTVGQCKLFANLIREGSWSEPRIDRAIPDRQPLPKPDVRRVMQPIGPVVVFGASNFPYAISVAGTDTVCALAAGCPVVVKAHPGHPGTCEMIGRAILAALRKTGLPAGSFSLIHGRGTDVGMALVRHPLTRAVAFTGSLRGGRALFDAAVSRPEPIPFYAEMGSVNPVFVLPGALKERAPKIAEAYITSVNMGVGQFCTNPALVLGLKGAELGEFMASIAALAAKVAPASMLHRGIWEAFEAGTTAWGGISGLRLAGASETAPNPDATQAACRIYTTTLEVLEKHEELKHEVFGPCSIITECVSLDDMLRFARGLEGQLTASIHGTEQDLRDFAPLIRVLERKVGRIIFNGFATGIEVCPSMHHGGPYPATTHSFFTSIGTASIYRFVRPVCYQNLPDFALPELLQNKNPRGSWRLIDGELTKADV